MTSVCVAHDYLTQRGGAERVALALLRTFPDAPLVTSVYEPSQTFPDFAGHAVRTSPLQAVRAFRRDPRLALPVLAGTWSSMVVDDHDVVVASSSGWAHGVGTAPGVRKVVYCHNPARWLHQTRDYVAGSRARASALAPLRRTLSRWDVAAASSADRYVVNSTVVAGRVWRAYGIEAEVVPPPVAVDVTGPQQPIEGIEPGFLLTVARGRGYKNTAVVEAAVEGMPDQRLVVIGSAAAPSRIDPTACILRLGVVSDAQLRWLYANARALVSVAHEDFGLTPIEANAFGTPAVLLRAGGFLDTLAEGVSGVFVEEPTAEAVRTALRELPDLDSSAIHQHAERFSEAAFQTRMRHIVEDVLANAGSAVTPTRWTIDLRPATRTGQRLAAG